MKELRKKLEKLLSVVNITTDNGIKMQDTRSKNPHINCGSFSVKFEFESKEDYLNWSNLYKEIVNDTDFPNSGYGVDISREAPFNLFYYGYMCRGFLFYKIREASKIHAANCYLEFKQ